MNHPSTITTLQLANTLAQKQDTLLIDVRTPAEFRNVHLSASINLPLDQVCPDNISKLLEQQGVDLDKPIHIICQAGKRSQMAIDKLKGSVSNPLILIEHGLSACPDTLLIKTTGGAISLERQVRIAAGSFVLIGVILGTLTSPLFYGLSGFVGAGLIFAGITDTCGMGMLLAKMPWNKA